MVAYNNSKKDSSASTDEFRIESTSRLRMNWWFYCSLGFIVGHLLFGFIGHGFTGPHEGRPTGASAVAHTIALIVAGLTVFSIQRIGLKSWIRISNKRIIAATLIYVISFQFAAYILRPPFDHIFGMPVLGIAAWISLDKLKTSQILLIVAAVFSFWIGVISAGSIIELVVPLTGRGLDSSNLLGHILSWVIGAGVVGVVGGFLSGWPLSKQLHSA